MGVHYNLTFPCVSESPPFVLGIGALFSTSFLSYKGTRRPADALPQRQLWGNAWAEVLVGWENAWLGCGAGCACRPDSRRRLLELSNNDGVIGFPSVI